MNKLGFGFLRLPRKDGEIDMATLNEMVDAYLAGGRTYFDTAYTYIDGKSELALRESLVKRHPRESFQVCTKLPGYQVKSYEECWTYFDEELERCGVEYFDVYMLHWLNRKHYRIAEETRQFDFLKDLKSAGKAKKIGFSYHDTADLLDEILAAHPEVDYVLLQLNYLDWDSESIQSRLCYETVVKHGKKVIVMEPVKGGTLANPAEEARQLLAELNPTATPASFALRFAESLPGVEIVLSGMGSLQQVQENIQERETLNEKELETLQRAAELINNITAIRCTGCGYCQKGCPQSISIPNYFRLYNDFSRNPKEKWKVTPAFNELALSCGKPSDCIGCGSCESHCPQKLPIREYLKNVAADFEAK